METENKTAMQQVFPLNQKYSDYLGEKEIEQLFSIMTFTRVAKNETIIPVGKPVKDVYYIKSGIVRLSMPDETGRDVVTHFAWEDLFITSLYSLICNKVSDETLVAVTDCELCHIDYYNLINLYDSFPKIERLGRIVTEESFACLAERGRMLQTMTAKQRYMHLMNTIPKDVFQKIPMQDIASYLGITPGSLSRIRNEFLHIC